MIHRKPEILDHIIRFRVTRKLRQRAESVAAGRVKTVAELGREAILRLVETEEARLFANGSPRRKRKPSSNGNGNGKNV